MSQMPNTIEKPPKVILEIGAGTNPLIEDLKKNGVDIGQAVVTDLNRFSFQTETTRKTGSLNDYSDLTRTYDRDPDILYATASASSLPFRDETFTDVVASNLFGDPSFKLNEEGFVHRAYKIDSKNNALVETLFKEIYRVLKTGGKVSILETYTPHVSKDFFENHKSIWEKYFTYTQGSDLISKDVARNIIGFREVSSLIFTLTKK